MAAGALAVAIICAGIVLAPGAYAGAVATPASDAIARLNAQRMSAGIPPVTDDPILDSGCAEATQYLARNGFTVGAPHTAIPGKPLYSESADAALGRSVLSSTTGWDGNPWEAAPYHLAATLHPGLMSTGWSDAGGRYSCLTVQPTTRYLGSEVYMYPGPNQTGVAVSETANELNSEGRGFVPGSNVGLGPGTLTGPYLYVFSLGKVSSASLVNASGTDHPELMVVNDELSQTSFLIPVRPLQPRSTYTAQVTLELPETTCMLDGTPEAFYAPALPVACPPGYPTWCVPCAEGNNRFNGTIPPQTLNREWAFTTAEPGSRVGVKPSMMSIPRDPGVTVVSGLAHRGVTAAAVVLGGRAVGQPAIVAVKRAARRCGRCPWRNRGHAAIHHVTLGPRTAVTVPWRWRGPNRALRVLVVVERFSIDDVSYRKVYLKALIRTL